MFQNLAMYKQKTGFFTKNSEALEFKTSIFRISIKFWFRKHPQTFWPKKLNKNPVALGPYATYIDNRMIYCNTFAKTNLANQVNTVKFNTTKKIGETRPIIKRSHSYITYAAIGSREQPWNLRDVIMFTLQVNKGQK